MSGPETPNLVAWTRIVGTPPSSAEVVVLVPPDSPGEPGLREAIHLARTGNRARLIMRGATAASSRRVVAEAAVSLVLSEVDAYLPGNKGPALRELMPGLKRWLGQVFAGALEGVDVSQAFWASAVTRLGLQDTFAAWCLALGIASRHGSGEITITDPTWVGVAALRSLVVECGGSLRLLGSSTRPVRGWGARFSALGSAMALGAVGLRAREQIAERATGEEVRRRRKSTSGREPATWLGVIGHWEFSSRHVLGALAQSARERGLGVGILLQSTLKAGALADAFVQGPKSREVLPVLSLPQLDGLVDDVDQCVSYEGWAEFIRAMPGTLVAMQRSVRQVAALGPEIDLGPFRASLAGKDRALGLLVTLDVLRAREAAAASHAFASRHKTAGLRVAWSHSSIVSDVVPDLILQGHGATTFDIVHGALAETQDLMTTAITFSTSKLLWTEAEANYLAPFVEPACIGAGPGRPMAIHSRAPRAKEPFKVLLLSNYATYAGGGHRRFLPRLAFQEILLDAIAAAMKQTSRRVELRWRPHPGDDPDTIARAAATLLEGRVPVSRGTALEDDLGWADIVIGSLSTTVLEALMHPVPLLVHDIPIHEAEVLMSLFPEERRFRDERDLPEKFECAVDDALSGKPLGPEALLRTTMFGPAGMPGRMGDVVFGTDSHQPRHA